MRYSIADYSLTAAAKGWGRGWPSCDARSQTAVVTAPISGVKVVVHKRIARLVYLLIAATEARGYLLRAGQCWGGNCRAIAGTDDPSNHSWWLAVDINSLANPYVRKLNGQPVTDMPKWLPKLWNAFGFAWGGDYSGTRADAMHEEFMGSPEDADEMTALAEQRLGPTTPGYHPPEDDDMFDTTRDRGTLENIAWMVGQMKPQADRLDEVQTATDLLMWAITDPGQGLRVQVASLQGQIAALTEALTQLSGGSGLDMSAVKQVADQAASKAAAEALTGLGDRLKSAAGPVS